MFRFRAALTALLFTALPVAAQAAPALWEVSDADSKIWLFGSMHIIPQGTQWHTPLFDDTLAKAAKVYFEADIGPWGTLGASIWVIKNAIANAQHPWLPDLTPEQRGKLDEAATRFGLKPDSEGMYDPWLTAELIESMALAKPGVTALVGGPDAELESALPLERKGYFETVAQQLNLMSSIPRDKQIASLMATLDDLEGSSGQLQSMAADWTAGNTDAVAKLMSADPESSGAMLDVMLLGRNRNWVPVIEQMLAQNQQNLIIVGAAHLIGDGSVTDLLGKAGFTVTRIQ